MSSRSSVSSRLTIQYSLYHFPGSPCETLLNSDKKQSDQSQSEYIIERHLQLLSEFSTLIRRGFALIGWILIIEMLCQLSYAIKTQLKAPNPLYSLSNSACAPKIKKLLPHFITHAYSVGMAICGWGKKEFFNLGLPSLSYASLKGPK